MTPEDEARGRVLEEFFREQFERNGELTGPLTAQVTLLIVDAIELTKDRESGKHLSFTMRRRLEAAARLYSASVLTAAGDLDEAEMRIAEALERIRLVQRMDDDS